MSINSLALVLPEVPFGGVRDSGYGSEGGSEALEAYLNTKFITQTGVWAGSPKARRHPTGGLPLAPVFRESKKGDGNSIAL